MEWLDDFLNLIKENQVLLTALGLGGAGTIILWLKGIPLAIYSVLKREFTTEVIMNHLILDFSGFFIPRGIILLPM